MVWDPVNLEIDSLPPHSPDDWNKLDVFFQYNPPHLRHGDLKFSPEKSHLWKSVTFSPECFLPGHMEKTSNAYTVYWLFCGYTGVFPPSGCLSPKVMCTFILHHHHHHHHHLHYYFKSQEFQLIYLMFFVCIVVLSKLWNEMKVNIRISERNPTL